MLVGLVVAAAPIRADSANSATLVDRIVDHIDRLYRSEDSHSHLEMIISNPNWERRLKMEMWTRGLKETLIRIHAPRKDVGITTLRKGPEMWNFFPRIDKVMKVPPSMMMSSWMGSDFSNDDLVKESTFTDDYTATLESADDSLLTLTLIAGEHTATLWPRISLTVRAIDLMPVTEIYYDEKDRAARRIEFEDVTEFSGRTLPATMAMTSLNKPGHRTIIRYVEAEFDTGISDRLFSLRELQRR
ncbi:MAG: outer membrane lipoprotein-sorting protein [Candidatus Latescibacterota bacterium]|nr:outer membrane lipoprotein-sorting protein [Candidatus Latescibacterota bacterium]